MRILSLIFFCCNIAGQVATPVVILNPETTKAGSDERSILIDVAVLRFLPKNLKDAPPSFHGNSVAEILEAMTKAGAGDTMYRSTRYLTGWPQQTVTFSALEHRPAFRFGGAGEPISYNSFGLNLKVGAAPTPASVSGESLIMTWDGSYSWSTNFTSRKVWETVLMGVMTAGQAVGATFTEEDPDEADGLRRGSGNAVGKDLVSLFKRKKKGAGKDAPQKDGVPQNIPPAESTPHYLDALRQEQPVAGQRSMGPDRLLVAPITSELGNDFEHFYLVVRYEWQ